MRLMVQSSACRSLQTGGPLRDQGGPPYLPSPWSRPARWGRSCVHTPRASLRSRGASRRSDPGPSDPRRRDAGGPKTFPPMCDSFAVIRKSGGALMLAGYRNATMDMLAASLAGFVGQGRPLIDKTGLSGRFDFTMEWAPESNGAPPSDTPTAASDPLGPTPLQALHDQLGLKLESAKGPVRILVIDRVERPSEN